MDKAEQEHSNRLFLIVGVLVGPSLVLGALGYYELAVKAFGDAACIFVFVVFVYQKASELDEVARSSLDGRLVYFMRGDNLWSVSTEDGARRSSQISRGSTA